MNLIRKILVLIVLMFFITSCAIPSQETTETPATKATAEIASTEDTSIALGEAKFTETESGLAIDVNLNNISPAGKRAFHIHEKGSCEEAGNAAGGHFNPDEVKHGYLPEDGFENAHAGDFGNIEIDEDGTGNLKLRVDRLNLTQGKYNVQNLAVIVHELKDDFGQPTGNAGGRIGCGIITKQ